ncbi:MAG TPA: hypothetical protein V6C78_20515 [Crinalium sp.]|jgi:hypothetical protein
MLIYHRKTVCFSLLAFDMPFWAEIEASATLYQKDSQRFHLLLTEPLIDDAEDSSDDSTNAQAEPKTPRLLWFEISAHRVIMTMQGNGMYSYRHYWEQGIHGLSRYWLQSDRLTNDNYLTLRNYTRSLVLEEKTIDHERFPKHLRVEYELWANTVPMGHYVLNLDIQD